MGELFTTYYLLLTTYYLLLNTAASLREVGELLTTYYLLLNTAAALRVVGELLSRTNGSERLLPSAHMPPLSIPPPLSRSPAHWMAVARKLCDYYVIAM